MRRRWPQWFCGRTVVIPAVAVDGMNLLWHSDLVVSGGGTMNREAAALGLPVYSIFRGPIGAVDRQLQQEGRLVLIESRAELGNIVLGRRERTPGSRFGTRAALATILTHIEAVISDEQRGESRSRLRGAN